MKKPTSLSDKMGCQECDVSWNRLIEVHAIQKEFKGNKYLTWANSDGSTHQLSKQFEFIHVWSEEESKIGKDGGTARLKAHRDGGTFATGNSASMEIPTGTRPPEKPFQYEQLSEHDRQTAEVIIRQVFELKHLAREIAKDYTNDDQNPASIGQVCGITLEALKIMREKK